MSANKSLAVLLIILGSALLVSSRPETRSHYCGSKLADALKKICSGRYNGQSYGHTGSSLSLGSYSRNHQRGVAFMCCTNPCTISTLASYCEGGHSEIIDSKEITNPFWQMKKYERSVEPVAESVKTSSEEQTEKQKSKTHRNFPMSFDEAIRNAPVIVTVSPEFARPAIYPGRI
ncbi:insulin-like growth factor I [Ctenocephalides felis]|uniref:insulin-like growth factor I n=1 Tax=Ctenocephalides felis TaxID=7515 RepID=UPI000E6E109D|nr:insulin-like growth factor I [Ctenocephalides felis]